MSHGTAAPTINVCVLKRLQISSCKMFLQPLLQRLARTLFCRGCALLFPSSSKVAQHELRARSLSQRRVYMRQNRGNTTMLKTCLLVSLKTKGSSKLANPNPSPELTPLFAFFPLIFWGSRERAAIAGGPRCTWENLCRRSDGWSDPGGWGRQTLGSLRSRWLVSLADTRFPN